MARKVFISSAMSYDETLSEIAEVEPLAALIWPWFLTYFDDWGRAKASPREIKNSVFQANDLVTMEVISNAISQYEGQLVRVYTVDGKQYMQIDPDKWFKHQTHIRKEKRENDGSKHPAPPAEDNAQVRAGAREFAESRANLTDCIPSPSPSLSFTTTTADDPEQTVADVHTKVFGSLQMNGLMSDFVMKLKRKGYQDAFIRELMLETGESGNKPSLRLMETIADRWMKEGIYTRVESKKRKQGGRALKSVPDKVDRDLEARRVEIARNKWINEGGEPSEFVYRPTASD